MDRGLGHQAPPRLRAFCAHLAVGSVLLLGAQAALAERIQFSNGYFMVRATNSNGTATAVVPFDVDALDDYAGSGPVWRMNNGLTLRDHRGDVLAQIERLEIPAPPVQQTRESTPAVVGLSFDVLAGDMDTQFEIVSSIETLIDPVAADFAEGQASSGLSVTDLTGDGALLSGDLDEGNAWSAQINPPDAMPTGGDSFAQLISDPLIANEFDTETLQDTFPADGFAPIGVEVGSISTFYRFTLSANDLASGTSVFVVVPEPASLSLLLIGGLAAAMRRRVA